MTTFIQAIALVIAFTIMVLVAKWQVDDDDIKRIEKRLNGLNKKLYKNQKL